MREGFKRYEHQARLEVRHVRHSRMLCLSVLVRGVKSHRRSGYQM